MSYAPRTDRTESPEVEALRDVYDAAVATVNATDRADGPAYAAAKAAELAAHLAVVQQITTERRAAKAAYRADPANRIH